MGQSLEIRDVPEELHAVIRARAAQQGLSISDYLLGVIRELMTQPTMDEIAARVTALAKAGGGTSASEGVAQVRRGRDR